MNERNYILSKLDDIGRATFLATENWCIEDWRAIRDDEYYSKRIDMGIN